MKNRTKNRLKKLFLIYLVLVMLIIGCLNFSSIKVRADSNYSNYLTSESISVKNDRALILLESSGSSNNYRNYYETSFLFPSKLRNEMYSTYLTTNPSKYYVQQAYLNDLDNEYAFKSVENLGQYQSNDIIENYSEITENNGNYDSYSNLTFNIQLHSQIGGETWWEEPNGLNHIVILSDSDSDYVKGWNGCQSSVERFNLGNLPNEIQNQILNITEITVYIVAKRRNVEGACSNDFKVQLYNDNFQTNDTIIYTTINVKNTYSTTFTDLNLNTESINDLKLKIIAPSTMVSMVGYFDLYFIYINFNIYPKTDLILNNTDNFAYNYISEGAELLSFSDNFNDAERDAEWIDDINGGTITETSNVLRINSNNDNWYPPSSIYNAPKCYISTSEFSELDWVVKVKIESPSEPIFRHWYGLMIYENDDNVWQFGHWEETSLNNRIRIGSYENKVLGTTITSEADLSLNQNEYLRIRKVESTYYFEYSDNDIDWFELHNDNALGINDDYVGLYGMSWVATSLDVDFEDFSLTELGTPTELNLTSNLQLNRIGNNFDNLESLELDYTLKSNDTSYFDLYLKNTDSNNFDLLDTNEITSTFQEFSYSFDLNYTYYNTMGLVNFTFYVSNPNSFSFSIDKISLNAVFSNFSINDLGYHNINVEFNRKTSGATNRGNISLNLQLYKNNFTYDYIENNVIESDYSRMNQFVDFSNDVNEIKEIEVQAHIRYGLNTLDIDIVNIYYKIIINYNYTFELYEQLRSGNNDGNYFRAFFSYDSMNFNRLNNTGIFGNYSTNCLSGLRVLRGGTDINYNRYFIIPYFDEKITLSYAPRGVSGTGSGSEPRAPSGLYWEYETFKLSELGITVITVENWSVDFNQVYAEKYEAKYFYQPKTIDRDDLGSWSFKISEFKVSFNFLRNAICDIINLILLFFQYIFFLVVASMSYILMYLGINILVLLWNIMIYYIFVALIWVLWYLYLALFMLLYYIWLGLEWVYLNLLIPFYVWFTETAIPYLVEFVIIPAVAFTITLVIWILTLGNVDFWELYAVVKENLIIFSNSFILVVQELIEHIVDIIIFIGLYLLLIMLCMLKKIVVKARGFVNRANALLQSYEAYIYPIEKFYVVASRIKELITSWI